MQKELELQLDSDTIYTANFFRELFEGGQIEPNKLLSKQDAKRVNDAIKLIEQFKEELEEAGIIEQI